MLWQKQYVRVLPAILNIIRIYDPIRDFEFPLGINKIGLYIYLSISCSVGGTPTTVHRMRGLSWGKTIAMFVYSKVTIFIERFRFLRIGKGWLWSGIG